MKNIFLSTLFSLFAGITASAEEWCLVVNGADQTTLAIAIAEKPVLTTDANGYVVTYGEQTANFAWSGIKSITMEQVTPTGVDEVKQDALQLEAGEIRLCGAKAGSAIRVYNIAGHVLKQAVAGADGSASVNISDLSDGAVYIIKTPSQTIKIKK